MATATPDAAAASIAAIALRHRSALNPGPPHPVEAWRDVRRFGPWLKRALAAAQEKNDSSASEWLLDNGYQIQRAIRQVAEDIPAGFYHRLRTLQGDDFASEPRILEVAFELLARGHGLVSRDETIGFLEEYQRHAVLDIAELWALPAMLRVASLERLAQGVADVFASVSSPVEASHCHRRRRQDGDPNDAVSRSIACLAAISALSWQDIFDQVSVVERILASDPGGAYPAMDFETRDSYRRAVEKLARRCKHDETAVAQAAIDRAEAQDGLAQAHVGFWLVGRGLSELERVLGVRNPVRESVARQLRAHPGAAYASALFLAGIAGLWLPAAYLVWSGATTAQLLAALALATLPGTVLAVTVVNWLVTMTVSPRVLPKLDFAQKIDPAWRTVVAMPVIVGHPDEVSPLLSRLLAHALANPQASACILLSDPTDADTPRAAGDEALERTLREGIASLNARYRDVGPFILLHRARVHNPAQGCWMARERKRGKLEDFNRFLLNGRADAFRVREGPYETLAGCPLVVTADADTRLPPGSVARLAGTLAHPLNRAVFDASGRVVEGYTVLQPRVELAPHGSDSVFAKLFGGDMAVDIYSRAVSDVYQDVLGSGNFVGKGIYAVAAFARSLDGRVPENALLSHDLWEGLHGRAGLVSDVIVYETFPASYAEFVRRWHRWVRGDWQLLPWLWRKVPGPQRTRLHNRLSLFDRLRIWDNMRRSLVPASVVALLLAGWLALPGNPLVWTVLALLAPAAWLFTDLVTGISRGRRRGVLTGTFHRARDDLFRWLLQVAFLLSDAVTALHAIGITAIRLHRRQRLLEWASAAHVGRVMSANPLRQAQWRTMAPSVAAALTILAALIWIRPTALPVALPLVLLWLCAPEVAWLTGRTRHHTTDDPTQADRRFLRELARRNWLFFETFARPEDHWLPPDNHQLAPGEATAHRTSPTNVGNAGAVRSGRVAAGPYRTAGTRAAHAGDAGDARTPAQMARTHPQLVRHDDTPAAGAPLCVERR
jgi:cyclic beta-1,2-glucan synthetase